jgi:uncharacterized protein involved in exopolysaccharide biosynthesis
MDMGDNRATFIEQIKTQIATLEQAIKGMEEEIIDKQMQVEALKQQIPQ